MAKKNTGIEFEKLVASIQSRVDPNASVSHSRILKDRHGHNRQFDVVIEGRFGGQDILGIIECKDFSKKVGTPEVDAFVTKSQDINANFKILVSKRGFSKPAIQKSKHYGIQTLSLIPNDDVNIGFKVGSYWFADVYYWDQLSLTILVDSEIEEELDFNPYDVTINEKKVIDWFTNYLIKEYDLCQDTGWVVGVRVDFDNNQVVNIGNNISRICKGLEFHAKKSLSKRKKFVGIKGAGFFDWQRSKATLPAQQSVKSDTVETNFMEWEERTSDEINDDGLLHILFVAHSAQLKYIENAINLDDL